MIDTDSDGCLRIVLSDEMQASPGNSSSKLLRR
ncbi:unnamed protein product [Thelazia callipaeda]|uniref:Transcriptional regulator n=1 Tax=Thelazia callipaeda TaxID=103827 RepID=A0A0N5CR77_THECL|nr:unnamed protein product [Thelazia callipaeda]